MKTKSTKIKNYLAILLIGLLPAMSMAQGKLGNLKEKAKEKVGSGKEKTTETTTTTTNGTTNTVGSTASNNVSNPGWVNVTAPTFSSGTDYTFTSGIKTDFTPSENIYLRFAFPKSITETIRAIKPSYEKSSAKISLAIAKDENDENPIIIDTRDISLFNYEKYNVVDYTLQADEATIKIIANEPREKVCFTSSSTMGVTSLNDEWRRKAALFKDGKHEWMVFLIFTIPKDMEEGASEMVAQGKFSFTINAENRGKLAEGMNFYDKQRFEKIPDDGYPTAVHKNNVSKIVFTNSFMGKTFDDATKVKSSYDNLAGGIYSRLYLKESMRNFYANSGQGKDVDGATYSLYFYVDGNSEYSCFQDSKISKEEAMTMTSWAIPLAPVNKEDFDYDNGTVNRFAYVISELAPGKHKIKVVAKSQYGATREESDIIGEGEFEINITAADRDAFVKKYGLQMPEKGLLATDAKLLSEVKIVAGKEAIDVRCPNVWEERKDAWGVVTHRVTIVAYSYKDEKGRGKQDTFMIKQPKTASGWGPTNATAEEKTWYGLDSYLPLQNSK